MKRIAVILTISLAMTHSICVYGQPDRSRKIVAMLIPNPQAPTTAESYDSPTTEVVYNTITSYLIEHNVSVIDKYYVDQALAELKNKKDLDIDAASIEYGKKNMADRAILFYVADKSASFSDKHFECTLKAINVRTGQIKAIVTEEGIHTEDKEKAAMSAAKGAIEKALPKIIEIEDLYTVTFIGDLSLMVQDKLDAMFGKIDGVKSFDGYLVDKNKYEYRVSYLYSVQTLRHRINQASKEIDFRLLLDTQSINSLSFDLIPIPNIHNRLRIVSGIGILASAAAGGISAYYANNNYEQYKGAKTYSDMIKYKNNTQKWDKYTQGAVVGVAITVLWYWFESSHAVDVPRIKKASLELYSPKLGGYGLYYKIRF